MPDPPTPPPGFPTDPTATHAPHPREEGTEILASDRIRLATWATSAPQAGEPEAPAAPTPSGPPFDLRRILGRGGMGEVWEATQRSLGRLVAVKRAIPRDDDQHAARLRVFCQEAAVAARLEHPNIVPVHDLGLDADGTPLLAMKLVRGRPWDVSLREDFERLSPEELLAKNLPILVAVGQAVAFAHSRGIVHRDLKPAQVMTGEFGEVLLMDWGLAIQASRPPEEIAAIDAPVEVATPETATSPAGTVALMAPEQTAPDAARIGPWTDVYLLGATLYFLLTGTYPHAAATSLVAFERARDGVIEDPRTRAPDRAMPEELVQLCLRALAPNPEERVPGARAFVDGLTDYIGGSSRRRESRALADSAQAALAATPATYDQFTSIAATLEKSLALWPENAQALALLDEVHSRHARRALESGDLVLGRTLAERVRDEPQRARLVAEADRLEARVRAKERQRRLLIGASFSLLLVIIVGGAAFAVKLDEQRRIAEENARRADQKAREARESRTQADGLVRFMITDLGNKLAPIDADLQALREAAVRAADYYTTQTMHPERLEPAERSNAVESLIDVAAVLTRQGEAARALESIRTASDFSTRHLAGPEALRVGLGALVSLGQAYRTNGMLVESMQSYERAIAMGEAAAPDDGGAASLPLARAYLCRADLLFTEGRREDAEPDVRRGLALLRPMVEAAPHDPNIVATYVWGAFKLVTWHESNRDSDAALAELATIRTMLLGLRGDKDASDSMRGDLGEVYSREGMILQSAGRLEEAREANDRAKALREELARERPTNVNRQSDLAVSITRGGTILADLGRDEEALAELIRGLELRESLLARDPANKELLVRVRASLQRIAEFHARRRQIPQAMAARLRSLDAARRLQALDSNPAQTVALAVELIDLGTLQVAARELTAARASLTEALQLLESRGPARGRSVEYRSEAMEMLGSALEGLGDPGAADVREQAVALIESMPQPRVSGEVLYRKARLLFALGRTEEARVAASAARDAGAASAEFSDFLRAAGIELPPPGGG